MSLLGESVPQMKEALSLDAREASQGEGDDGHNGAHGKDAVCFDYLI